MASDICRGRPYRWSARDQKRRIHYEYPPLLERFRAKWVPVRVKKTRQNKKLEPGFDSIKAEKAPA
jgi:hypothetical protein